MVCISFFLVFDILNVYFVKMIIILFSYYILEFNIDLYFLLKKKDIVLFNLLGVYFDFELNVFFYRFLRIRLSVCFVVLLLL